MTEERMHLPWTPGTGCVALTSSLTRSVARGEKKKYLPHTDNVKLIATTNVKLSV